jgi:3-dehydroquinate synthase
VNLERVRVELGSRAYEVVIGTGAIAEVTQVLAGRRRVAVVSQERVAGHHGDAMRDALDAAGAAHEIFLVGDGEEHKRLATVDDLARRFARFGLLRDDAVVALGGGIVGDIAGFAAATYHRGVAVVQVPTTLLAMVDAAIGGKTGVNLPEGKNLVGAFHQPIAVLADPSTLSSLPERELACGLGEVAKYALLGDDELAATIERDAEAIRAREQVTVSRVVVRCARAKARVVVADELERTGARAALNLGHTLGHALEIACGHDLPHGEAVAVGLVFAGNLAAALERVTPDVTSRWERLVGRLGLPTRAPAGLDGAEVVGLMRRDKKSVGSLSFVLPGPGGVERVDDPDEGAVAKALAAVGIEG